jgi:hypothetical protein
MGSPGFGTALTCAVTTDVWAAAHTVKIMKSGVRLGTIIDSDSQGTP